VTRLPAQAPPRREVRVLATPEDLARAGAREFAAAAREAVAVRKLFRVVLSGGSTPKALYERLAAAPYRSSLPWLRTRFFWGDERCVPPGDERSNFRSADRALLAPLRIPPGNVLRMRGEDEPRRAARLYERVLRREFGSASPRFDLVFLGLGADGHTASLFPGGRALAEKQRWVVASGAPAAPAWRLTLTLPAFNAARRVVFLVAGREKGSAVRKILKREAGFRSLPASRIAPRRGSLLWLLDAQAAGELYPVRRET
jgi:6-phosphogluconolactonase